MSVGELALSGRAAELRQAFDRSFAEPLRADTRSTVDFIAIRVGERAHAVRMDEIAGLFADVRITPCPGPLPELRGIAGFRGALIPVYDLGLLLGHPASSARWIVLAKGRGVALAFDGFDEHFRVDPIALAAPANSSAARHVREVVQTAGRAWPVIDIPSVVAAITARAASASSQKEH